MKFDAFIENITDTIMSMDSETRIEVANTLLIKLEHSKDITRWQFWDRVSVKDHAEELAERELDTITVNSIMDKLNSDWNTPRFSLRDTDAFTEAVNKSIK